MRVFITGDKHGDFSFLDDFCATYHTTQNDVLIVLGDAGILYYGAKSRREKYTKDMISRCPVTLFCVRGNHEDRAEDRVEMVMKEIFDNTVYYDPCYSNILYAIDGCRYEINNESFFVIGGAYSVDKFYRLTMGWKWNPKEQLTNEEMLRIEEKIEERHFNHILAHTCPFSWEPTYLFLRGLDQSTVDNTMEHWLEDIVRHCSWDNYWFGHFHGDNMDICGDGKVHMLFNDIKEIKHD